MDMGCLMRKVFGWILIVGGIALGIYVGVWVMFVGGVVQLIDAVKVTPVDALNTAFGLVRIILSGITGWCLGACGVTLGMLLL